MGFGEVETERNAEHAHRQGFGTRYGAAGPAGEGRLAVTSLTPPAADVDAFALQFSGDRRGMRAAKIDHGDSTGEPARNRRSRSKVASTWR